MKYSHTLGVCTESSPSFFLIFCFLFYFFYAHVSPSKDGIADVVQTPVSQRGNDTDLSIRPHKGDVGM